MLYTRSHLEQRIREEKFRTCRTGSPFTLVLFNPHKLVSNNSEPKTNGLEELESILDRATRHSDIQGWWDKKTYAILLLDTFPGGAYAVIEKLIFGLKGKGYGIYESPRQTLFEVHTFPDPNQGNGHNGTDEGGEETIDEKNNRVNSIDNECGFKCLSLENPKAYFEILKRSIDILLSATLLLIFLPLLIAVALLIKLDSPGPVIYRQTRVGKKGKHFTFYKFRTMYFNCDETIHQIHVKNLVNKVEGLSSNGRFKESSYKLMHDNRITRVGNYVRNTSLDEIPQLFNVLKGDMSLVGPRPHPVYEVEIYKDWFKYRLDVKPGITGLGQVDGRYNKEYEEVYRLDLRYVKSASIVLDLKILFKTALLVLSSRGAY
jgi:lipopolysaccharide/colanic/teichoic acid biosynthesis glycosyltransferase